MALHMSALTRSANQRFTRVLARTSGARSGRRHLEHALHWHAGVYTLCQWRFFDLVQRPVGHAQPAGSLVGDAPAAAPRYPWPAPVGQWQSVCNWHRCHALRRHDRFGRRASYTYYTPQGLVSAIVVGVGLATLALAVHQRLLQSGARVLYATLLSGSLLGLSVAGMHYAAMGAIYLPAGLEE